jgi:hypothetical protein
MRRWCQVFRWLLKTQNRNYKERLRCFAFSMKMQAERDNLKTRNNHSLDVQEAVLCKKMNLSV